MALPQTPDFHVHKHEKGHFLRVVVNIPGLESRRTSSIRFKGIRPKIRRAARNADIIFAAANRTCTLDVTLRLEDQEPKSFRLHLEDLPFTVHSPPKSFYESEELTLLTNSPILTSCFQDTILTWIPVGFLIISAIHSVRSLRRRKVIHLSWRSVSVFCNIKTVLCIFLAVLGLARFLNALIHRISNDDGRITNAALLSSFLTVVAQAYVAALTHVTFRRGRHTSGVLFIFWSFALICGVTSLVSQVHYVKSQDRIPHVFQFAISCASFLLIVVQFFANCFADKAALRKESQGPQPSEFALKEQAHYKDPNSKDIMLDGHVQNPLLEEQSGKEQVYVKRTSPQEFASFLSCATFWWFNWIVAKGFRNPLKYSDLWDLSAENLTGFIFLKFEAEWKRVKEQHEAKSQKTESSKVKQPSLLLALVRTYGAFYATGFLLLLVHSVFFVANPIILDTFIHFMQDKDNPYTWQGYTLALLMFGCTSVAAFIRHNAVYIGYITSLRIKTVVITNVYRKMLRLSCTARKESSGGAMVNMMAVDAQKLPASLVWSHYVVVAPLELVFTVLLLWRKIGVASLVGVAFLALIVPLNLFVIGSQIKKAQMAQMKLKDERLKLMNQVLSGIKVLKLYAWEPHFQDKILAVRKKEVRLLRKIALLHTINGVITYSAVAMVAVLCFVTYVSISDKNILTPDVTFVSLSIISMMNVPAFLIPSFTILAIQGMVSLKRIQKFLLLPEIDPESITHSDLPDSVIQLENATFSWGDRPILNDLNIRVKTGELVAVVGRVGAGKSSVISGLLGDMEKISGSVNIQGSIAYVPQQAWIQNLTLRDNILFSCPYVQTKYENVLESCALNADLQMLPAGDMTEIGERGINLSGGQKQRVSLARAVYQEEDIYLLDDPLSAVDAHVGKHLFEKVIGPEGVLKNKTRILVTNSVSVLPYVDRILVFVDGSLVESGILEELKAKEGAFVDFLQHHVQTAEQDDEAADELGEDAESDILSRQLSSSSERSWIERQLSRQASSVSEAKSKMDEKKETENGKSGALVGEELAKEGMVKCSVLRTYVLSASLFNMGLATVGFLVTIGGYVGNNVWLSIWSDEVVNARNVTRTDTAQHIGIYSGLAAVQLIGQLFLSLAICLGVLTAAKNLHRVLLTNIFRCPMAFFDTTPLGRIINRFSKDVDNLDSDLREYIHSWLMNFAILVAVIIIICYSTPIFMVAAIPIALAFFGLQRVYIATARQLKRIDSIRRSPIFANFSETINGVSSIRAYNQEQRFISHADAVLNDSHKVWYTVFTSNRWIGVLADFLASVIVLCSALSCVIQRDSIDPGTAGLSMSFALQINQQIVQIVRYSCEIETYIVAVERIKEYFDEPKEAPFVLEGKSVAESWPPKGEISFNDYSTRYRPGLQLVLKGMTFKIDPGEKVGVIGRTGAGKSSLTLSLFRIIEAAGGAICIDGEDISSMGLHDLRSRLTIIPQDPVLFSGSLRFNVDPSEEYTDEEVLNALTLSHLKDFVASLPEGLDYECGEDGQNLSVGQRQLVCLTRALLRKTKVLILDEATAAVDMTTDDLIQRTIRTEFSQCTIVTIAHRLQTIMDYDRILVMDEGKLKEFDSPNKLLSKSSSIFYGMVKDAGLI